MAIINAPHAVEGRTAKFIFCLSALEINCSLPTTALTGRHIYNIGAVPTNARRLLTHSTALNTTTHVVTVPNSGYYELSVQFSAVIASLLTELAICRNWLQQNNSTTTPPVANRLLYVNAPVDASVTGRVSYSRLSQCWLNAGDTLQLIEIGASNTDFENFSISIKEL
jgi:hypothetical protein